MADVDDAELKMARRHVAEGEARIAAQRRLIDRMEEAGQPTELAHQLLRSLEDTLEQMQLHRRYLERANDT